MFSPFSLFLSSFKTFSFLAQKFPIFDVKNVILGMQSIYVSVKTIHPVNVLCVTPSNTFLLMISLSTKRWFWHGFFMHTLMMLLRKRKLSSSMDSNEMFRLQNYKFIMSSTEDSMHSSSSCDSNSESGHSTPAWHAECSR